MKTVGEERSLSPRVGYNERPHFRDLIERSDAGIAFLDLGFRVTFANARFKTILGYSDDDVLNLKIDAVVPRGELALAKAQVLKTHARYVPLAEEVFTKTGNSVPCNSYISLVRGDDGTSRYYRVMLRELKAADEREPLHPDSQRLQHVLKHLPIMLTTVDKNGVFTNAEGKGFETVLERCVGLHYTEVYKDLPESQMRIARVLSGESFSAEFQFDGFWFQTHYAPLFDQNGNIDGATWFSIEIGEKKYMERTQEALLAKEQAKRAQAEAGVKHREELLSLVSHEIKTPLTSLKLALSLFERGYHAAAGVASDCRRHIDRIAALVSDVLDASRLQEGALTLKPSRFDLGALLQQLPQNYGDQLRNAKCGLEVSVPSPLVGCWDNSYLEQAFVNLLSNAMKYGAGKPIHIRALVNENKVRVEVADQGIGIRAEDCARIFERFVRVNTQEKIGGTGLGLFITKQIVEAHGGRIGVESKLGAGSTFSVELPLSV